MATIALIPGAGGDSGYWYLVSPLLQAHGYDVVSVDLPTGDEHAGIEEYADAVEAAVGDRTDLVVVAQSLGAFTAVEIVERMPVSLLVFVAAMIPKPGESSGRWWESTGQFSAQRHSDLARGRNPDAAFDTIDTYFHDVPQAVVEEIARRGEPPQSTRPFESPNAARAWLDVPCVAIAGTLDRLFPIEFMRKLVLDRVGTPAIEIEAGHLIALSRPKELADAILAAVETPPRSPAAAHGAEQR
jgi:pimeloyl-ACP methyl ester carboxylesterase